MQTETIEITGLPPGTLAVLEAHGRSQGQSVADYLRDLVQTDLLSEKPFSEILGPIRRSFDESGMSDAELDTLFMQARDEALREKSRPTLAPHEKVEALRQWVAGFDRHTPLLSDEAISRASIYTREDAQR